MVWVNTGFESCFSPGGLWLSNINPVIVLEMLTNDRGVSFRKRIRNMLKMLLKLMEVCSCIKIP